MNKKYSKHLFRIFEAELKTRWPQFKKVKCPTPSGRAYAFQFDGSRSVFIFLWPHPKGWQQFFCEFGWSPFPCPQWERSDYRFPLLQPRAAFCEVEMVAGVQRLWGDNGIGAWKIPDPVESFEASEFANEPAAGANDLIRRMKEQEQLSDADAENLVRPVVHDLVRRIDIIVMPYLMEYVSSVASGNSAVS